MAAIFIRFGYGKAMNPSGTMAMMAHYNLPLPGVAYAVSLLVELGAGLAFLLGWKALVLCHNPVRVDNIDIRVTSEQASKS